MKSRVRLLAGLLALPWIALPIEPMPTAPDLAMVRRIFIDQIGGGHTSDQMRDMIIAALQNSKLFVITENPDRADATLRGSSDDKIYNEQHDTNESIGLHTNSGSGSGTSSSMSGSTSSHRSSGVGLSDNESTHIQERRHETSASIRLVNADGDVIWSTTQESSGGKFRGAMADVADKVTRQLAEDTRKARAAHIP